MRNKRSASGCAAFAATYCRMTGVCAPGCEAGSRSEPCGGSDARVVARLVVFGIAPPSEIRIVREGERIEVDEHEPLLRSIDDRELPERLDEAHRAGAH